jgi:hypothetical protein
MSRPMGLLLPRELALSLNELIGRPFLARPDASTGLAKSRLLSPNSGTGEASPLQQLYRKRFTPHTLSPPLRRLSVAVAGSGPAIWQNTAPNWRSPGIPLRRRQNSRLRDANAGDPREKPEPTGPSSAYPSSEDPFTLRPWASPRGYVSGARLFRNRTNMMPVCAARRLRTTGMIGRRRSWITRTGRFSPSQPESVLTSGEPLAARRVVRLLLQNGGFLDSPPEAGSANQNSTSGRKALPAGAVFEDGRICGSASISNEAAMTGVCGVDAILARGV